jgi:phosphoglycerate dehydrogenase-like enzyme
MTSLRVVVATPLPEPLCELIELAEPRLELVRDQSLLPPQLHPGDHNGDPSFRRTTEQQAMFERLVDTAEALYGLPDQSPDALRRTVAANGRLRWVHTTPAGGGGQVKAAALSPADLERVVFTTSAGVHAEPLAEFAVLGVMAGAKELPRLLLDQRTHTWAPRRAVPRLAGRRVLVVGLGGIGRAVSMKLAALGARVTGVHRREVHAPGVTEIVPPERLPEEIAKVEAIVMCLPGTDATRHLLSRDLLASVTPGITIVNVGRGSTIHEPALVEALGDGRVGFAALDVFEQEPLPASSPLWDMPNVLVSPHNMAIGDDEERLVAELFAANATRLIAGEPLVNVVNTVEFY